MTWTKAASEDLWTARAGPFSLKVRPKGDGRWTWEILKDEARDAMATGVARSFGSAKSVAEQFVNRSGLI
jgi:hypothetical protein